MLMIQPPPVDFMKGIIECRNSFGDAAKKCIQTSYMMKGLVVCHDRPLTPFTSLDRIAEKGVVIDV